MQAGTWSRARLVGILGAGIALVVAVSISAYRVDVAGAGLTDAGAAGAWIVPTANNPDVNPGSGCQSPDVGDNQSQSPAGSAANAVLVSGCVWLGVIGGPRWEGPAVFETTGPGGLLCQPGSLVQTSRCAFASPNAAGSDFQILVNNETGVNAPGSQTVRFCADDPPVESVCGPEDEEVGQVSISWKSAAGGGGGGTGASRCGGKPATIVAAAPKTKGTRGNDVIVGRKGKDKISGKGGKDRICGKGGKDKLKGGGGKDKLKGGPAADRLSGGGGRDTCKGGPGRDRLKSCEKGS